MPTYVEEIAAQVAEGQLDALVNGTLFRSIRGVQSKLELINTPNVLESLSRCACMRERGACAASLASRTVWPQISAFVATIYNHSFCPPLVSPTSTCWHDREGVA